MGLIIFIVLIAAVTTWYLHVKRKEKQEFLDRYKRYRVGDKGAFVGFNRLELKPDLTYDANHGHYRNINDRYNNDPGYSDIPGNAFYSEND